MRSAAVLALLAGLAAAAPGKALVQRTVGTSRNPMARSNKGLTATAPNRRITKIAEVEEGTETSTNWSGAVKIGSGYTQVQGTIIVPEVSGNSDAAASAWVGIDGDTCQTAILQTGISFYADGSFDAWYEWIPDYSYSFSGFSVHVGDEIKMVVDATSKTKGVATLSNLTTGKTVSHTFTSTPSTLCETNAEWIVEAFQSGGSQVDLA